MKLLIIASAIFMIFFTIVLIIVINKNNKKSVNDNNTEYKNVFEDNKKKKRKWKKTNFTRYEIKYPPIRREKISYSKRGVSVIGIIIAVILFIAGIFTEVPSKLIEPYNLTDNGYEEYVGGDAYNYQIEASLRGGVIAGTKTQKAIYISMSCLILIISLYGLCNDNTNNKHDTE